MSYVQESFLLKSHSILRKTKNRKRTKIIATIGPSSSDADTLEKMVKAGLNVCRLNFSHGNHASHAKAIRMIRKVAEKLDTPIAILVDLQGPKIRVGTLKDGKPIHLKNGDILTITTDTDFVGDQQSMKVSCSYQDLVRDTDVGKELLIDDGLIKVVVIEKKLGTQYDEVKCKVIVGGLLKERKGINAPGTPISAPALTDKDKDDLEFALNMTPTPNYVCLSYVRKKQDILDCKEFMKKCGKVLPIIAKIERQEAIDNIDEIISEADGIMVARGDLGIETPLHELPIVQKQLIRKSSDMGKIDITATQMLASMVDNPLPTRAEVCDVANAIFDGTDAVMLSNETTVGKYPVEAVKTMADICRHTDSKIFDFIRHDFFENKKSQQLMSTRAIALAASTLAKSYRDKIKLIVCLTLSGATAIELSQHRSEQPVIAITLDEDVYHKLALAWGIFSLRLKNKPESDKVEDDVRKLLIDTRWTQEGDKILLVSSYTKFSGKGTNTLQGTNLVIQNTHRDLVLTI